MPRRFLAVLACLLPLLCVPLTAGAVNDVADHRSEVTETSPRGTWLHERLASLGDVDWFRFRLKHDKYSRIRLGDLAADYALALYDASGERLAKVDADGIKFEQIYKRLHAGRYFVKVWAPHGEVSDSSYVVRFDAIDKGVQVLSKHQFQTDLGDVYVYADVVNNTGHRIAGVDWVFRGYTKSGSVKVQESGTWDVQLKNHAHGPIAAKLPQHADHYTFITTSAGRATAPKVKLAKEVVGQHTYGDTPGVVGYTVRLTNTGEAPVWNPFLGVIYYGDRGKTTDIATQWCSKDRSTVNKLPVGSSCKTGYDFPPGDAPANRAVWRPLAYDHKVPPVST